VVVKIKLTEDEAEYLKDQLDGWIEGFSDIDDDMPYTVVLELLHHREMAERIRDKIWQKLKK